jgi:hypothetical protein
MRMILTGLLGLATVAISCLPAAAGPAFSASATGANARITLIQSQQSRDLIDQTDRRDRRRQRYVCVVQPRQSDDRNRPYVCRADEGRVGGTCRCSNVTGTGRLDLDD